MAKAMELAKLNWVRTGTDHAETVVLIHGVAHDLTYWDRQIEALSTRYNVVAFDLPGHGRSRGDSSDWSFDYAAKVVTLLIEEASDRPVHLVGISFGGMIAQFTTLSRPDLISSLTLIGTASSFPDEVRQAMRSRAALVRERGMAAVVESSLQRWFSSETRQRRPHIVDRVTKTLLGDDVATHAAIWDVISDLDIDERVSAIQCPTLVLVGEQDPSTPPSVAEVLASRIHGAKLVIIPNASHIVTIDAAEEVNDILLDFLIGTSRPRKVERHEAKQG